MHIRMARRDDIGDLKNIWSYCFEDSQAYVDFYFDKKCELEKVVVLDDGSKIISSIYLNQHKIKLNDSVLDTSYVVGVSTLPEARGLGKMGYLMKYSLDKMRELGQSVSILMPIDFRLYTKFGYANVYDMKRVEVDIFSLKKFKLEDGFSRASIHDALDLGFVYKSFCSQLNGYAIRSELYFKELIEEMDADSGHIYIAYRDLKPVAYIVYNIDGGVFTVRELYYIDRKSYESVLKFIFNHNTQAKKVIMHLAVSDPIIDMLDNPKDAACVVENFMMARIIDFQSLVDRISIKSKSKEKIRLRVEDDYMNNNNGVFEIYTEDSIVRTRRLKDDANYDLSLNIRDLSSLIFSYRSIREVAFLSCKNVETLNSLKKILNLAVKKNHINEYV